MDRDVRSDLISQLAQDMPRYVYSAKEFVPGKTPILYSGPFWDHREIEAALKTFLTGAWVTAGTEVFKFQTAFAKKFGVKYAHMVNSGSSANLCLITALKKRHGWQEGDEIIVSPVGFPTTIAPIAQNNLKPVFVDIEMTTLNFDIKKIESKITERTKAIFVSPVLGNPPDMDFLVDLCKRRHVMLIGDNCDSLGSRWKDNLLTDHYEAWTTSFYPAHHMTTGEGGMVCSNDDVLMNAVRSISWWGRACYCVGQANLLACGTCGSRFSKWLGEEQPVMDHKYVFENMGYNLKPLDLQGAIGLVQLEKFDEMEKRRAYNFLKLTGIFSRRQLAFRVAKSHFSARPSWFGVPIVCSNEEVKNSLVSHLETNKIQTRNYFAGNLLVHPGYKHLDDYRMYPNANEALRKVFFIGCPPHFTDEILTYIDGVERLWKL